MAGQNSFLQSPFQSIVDKQVAPLPGSQQVTEVDTPDLSEDSAPAAPAASPAPAAPRSVQPASLLPPKELQPLFEATAAHFKVPVNVLMAIAQQESTYNPEAVNPASGAAGIGGYMSATAKSLGINPRDPNEAVPAIAQQLRERLDKGYDMADAVKEHFAGPDRKLWGEKTAAYGAEVLAKAGQIGRQLYGDTADATAPEPAFTPGAEQNQFAPNRMARADYEKEFRTLNPKASDAAVKNAMAQYDQQVAVKTAAAGNRVQDKFATLQSPEAMFDARLNAKLQAGNQGVAQALPERQQPAAFPETGTPAQESSTLDTVAGNLTGGALGTLVGAIAAGAKLVGADDTAKEFSEGVEQIRGRQKELGGDTFAGKVSSLVGGIVPALSAAPESKVLEFAKNAGLFGIPAFQETYKAKLAEGQSDKLALVHAFEAFGMNTLAPLVMQHGMGAVIGKLGAEGAAGIKGAALGLVQAAGEGVAFSGANTVMDKGTDVLAGQQNDRPWIDPEDMAVQAAGFGGLRGAHMVGHAVGEAIAPHADPAAQAAQVIARAGRTDPTMGDAHPVDQSQVDAAVARADAAAKTGASVADQLRAIRPPEPAGPLESAVEHAAAAPTTADAGPMSAAIDQAAAQHEVDPAPTPEMPPAPPDYTAMPLDDLRAALKDVAGRAQRQPDQRKALMAERKQIEQEIAARGKQAKADSKPAVEPLSAGPFDDMKSANRMMERYAEQTGVPHEVVGSEGKFRVQPIGGANGIDTAGTERGTDGRGRSSGPADAMGSADGGGRAGTGTGVVEGAAAGQPMPAEKRAPDATDHRAGADGAGDAADAVDPVAALAKKLQPQADHLTNMRNEAVRKFNAAKKVGNVKAMESLKTQIDGFDAKRRQITHQIFLEGQKVAAKQRADENGKTYGAMDIGTKIGMIGYESHDDTYFQKVGPNKWQRTMGGVTSDHFKTDAEMEGKRVIASKENDYVPERPQVPEEAPAARGAEAAPAGKARTSLEDARTKHERQDAVVKAAAEKLAARAGKSAVELLKNATRPSRIKGMEGQQMPDPVAREIVATSGIDKLDAELAAQGVKVQGIIGAGAGNVVLDAGEHVVRLGTGPATKAPKIDGVLQPVKSGSVGGIRYDIMPKVETKGITQADVDAVSRKVEAQGYEFTDAGTDNVGKLNGEPVIIDLGAVEKAKSAKENAHVPERPQVPEEETTARGAQGEKPAAAGIRPAADSGTGAAPAAEGKLAKRRALNDRQDEVVRSASENLAARKTHPTVRDRMLEVEREDDTSAIYSMMDDSGKKIGHVMVLKRNASEDGRPIKVVQIHNAGIDEAEARGKGYGIRAYTELVDKALAEGKQVWSDPSVSADAARMYDALKRRGYDVQKNKSKPATTADDGTLVSDGSFVFKVTAGPSRNMAEKSMRQPVKDEFSTSKNESARDVPKSFFKKVKVDHDVYIRDERRWETVKVPADKALASVREDIGNLEALLNCMKG